MSSKKPIVVVKKEPGSRPEPEDNGGATRSGGSGLCPCLRICASAPATQCPRPATRASRRSAPVHEKCALCMHSCEPHACGQHARCIVRRDAGANGRRSKEAPFSRAIQ